MSEDKQNNQNQQQALQEVKSALKPMGKKPPRRVSGLRKRKRFLAAQGRMTLQEYLAKFFRIRRCRHDRLTIVTLRTIVQEQR